MNPLHLPERIYFSAPFATEEQRAFNLRVITMMRHYNFPVFFPQEHWQDGIEEEAFTHLCLEELSHSHLLLAVCYGNYIDTQTAFEIGFAQGRRHQVLCLRNNLIPQEQLPEDVPNFALKSCLRFIDVPERDEDLLNPLISTLNRFYGSYSTSILS